LKNIFYEKTNKKENENIENNYSRDNELNEIKKENKELEKKIEIMVERLKNCSEENKEYEAKVEKLKKDVKDLKVKTEKASASFKDLTKGKVDSIEIKGVVINKVII
jgi:peptidoglycan hydrolase CwlO-like protein